MQNKILLAVIIFLMVSTHEKAMTQIPAKGADFPTLADLQWGMTMNEARGHIAAKREIQTITSTTFSYEDNFLSFKATIHLQFIEKDKEMILSSIDIPLMEPTKESVMSVEIYLMSRYGNHYESKKTKKSKFFITLDMELKSWRLDNEEVGLMVCRKGEDILGTNITYHISKTKKQ